MAYGRTLVQLRQGVGRKASPHVFYGTANSSGNDTTSVLDDGLGVFPTGLFIDYYLLHTSSTNAGTVSRVSDFSVSSGTGDCTITPALGTAVQSVTFELHSIHPDRIAEAINRAARLQFPKVSRQVVEAGYFANDPLWNGLAQEWTSSSAMTGWSVTTSTLARNATNPLHGSYMARLSAAAGRLDPSVPQQYDYGRLASQSLTFYALTKTSTASSSRLAIVDGTGTTNGSYHTGGGYWELLSASRGLDTHPDGFNFRFLKDSASGTIDIGRFWTEGGPAMRVYRSPVTMPHGPTNVYWCKMENREDLSIDGPWQPVPFTLERHDDPNVATSRMNIVLPQALPDGWIKYEGNGVLTNLSADADVAELDEVDAELLETEAALIIIEENMGLVPYQAQPELERRHRWLQDRRDELGRKRRENRGATTIWGSGF